jgi:superfamily II DNA or RNA helicase
VVPVIVAESLERVDLPLMTMLHGLEGGEPERVIAGMADAFSRPGDTRPLPGWLRPHQQLACSRLLPILDRYGGGLLADPVGSGKTYVALGIAAVRQDPAPALVLAPAVLLPQWERAAAGVRVSITTWSHERLSRRNAPAILQDNPGSPLVIIDESHHFRNPAAQRYRHLAPLLKGRRVLLLSATPVVNRLDDLVAQLLLGVRDDALIPFGLPSIRTHLGARTTCSPALAELILTSRVPVTDRPVRVSCRERSRGQDGELEGRCQQIEELGLSTSFATAALIRSVIWRAMASSDMALLAVLRRYRSLLLNARDAASAGSALSRTMLRKLAGEAAEQLVWWEFFPQCETPGDLVAGDLGLIDALIEDLRTRSHTTGEKCRRLAEIVADGKPTLVFTCARETVRYLRDRIAHAAWCTGSEAGIGITRMDREDVLFWFRPGAPPTGGPTVLITTDVSAEGLDLQHAARVIHYDLPWTAVRLDQRDGRALRLGSRHRGVEVIRFEVPVEIERRLGQVSAIARKRRLPGKAGLDRQRNSWNWRDEISARYGAHAFGGGPRCCRVLADESGILAGFSVLTPGPDQGHRIACTIGYLDAKGDWTEDPGVITLRMETAVSGVSLPLHRPEADRAVAAVAGTIRERLKVMHLEQWAQCLSPFQSRLLARLNRIAARAVHSRNRSLLSSLERAIDFVRRGHTAGEHLWLEDIAELPDSALIGALRQCPETRPRPTTVYSELTGLVVFAPSSSISTER